MGQIFMEYLSGPRIYCCNNCRAHAAKHDEVVSKSFHGRWGRAYLFNKVVNVGLGPKEDRQLITGMHTVNDIYCNCCRQVLGWRYEKAYEEREKYKEGKYIIEKKRMTKVDWKQPYRGEQILFSFLGRLAFFANREKDLLDL